MVKTNFCLKLHCPALLAIRQCKLSISFQKYFVFLLFVAITSEFTISQSALATGQLINRFDERPLTKVNAFHDNADGIIILAAFRRSGRRKYKKVIEVTTEKARKVTIDETVKPSTTTEKVVQVTTEKAMKVTQNPDMQTTVKVRRNKVPNADNRNGLWIARKRVTRPPKSVPTRKKVVVNVVDEEEYSIRRARYLFSQRSGKR